MGVRYLTEHVALDIVSRIVCSISFAVAWESLDVVDMCHLPWESVNLVGENQVIYFECFSMDLMACFLFS